VGTRGTIRSRGSFRAPFARERCYKSNTINHRGGADTPVSSFGVILEIRFGALAVVCAFLASACGCAQQTTTRETTSYVFHSLQVGGGGFITGVLFHPTVKGLAYIRTDIGGAYRWDETAKRWTSLSGWVSIAESNLLGIESMAVDPSHADDLYLAAGTYTNPAVPNGALLRSHDRGAHFDIVRLPFKLGGNEPGRFAGERLAVDGSAAGTMYLGTRNDGLWQSKDSGSTWHPVVSLPSKGEKGLGVLFVLPVANPQSGKQTIYVGVADRELSLYESGDSGNSWNAVHDAPKGMFPYRAAVAADGALYITYGNEAGPNDVTDGAVYRRDVRGKWADISPAKPVAGETGWGYAGLALDARHPGTVMTSTLDRWHPGDTIFLSEDDGKHWVSLKEDADMDSSYSPFLRDEHGATPFGHWIAALGIDPFDPEHAIYGTGATLWETHDLQYANRHEPTHWRVDTRGIEETAVISLLKPKGDPLLVGLGDIGCFRAERTEPGVEAVPFTGLALSNCDSVATATKNPRLMAAVGRTWGKPHHGGFSLDGGLQWTPFPVEPTDATDGGRVAISADGNAIFWTTHRGSFVTFDQGRSWSVVTLKAGLELVTDPVSSTDALLLDTKEGDLYMVQWIVPSPNTATPDLKMTGKLHVLPSLHLGLNAPVADGSWLYGDAGLFQLDSATHALKQLSEVQAVYALGFGKGTGIGSTLFLAGQIEGEKGLYRSTDHGRHWTRFTDDGHGFGWITAVTGDPDVFGKVYLGTNGLGIVIGEPQSAPKQP
jgi:hypothetical protein